LKFGALVVVAAPAEMVMGQHTLVLEPEVVVVRITRYW
jgi:hypothetical protein